MLMASFDYSPTPTFGKHLSSVSESVCLLVGISHLGPLSSSYGTAHQMEDCTNHNRIDFIFLKQSMYYRSINLTLSEHAIGGCLPHILIVEEIS